MWLAPPQVRASVVFTNLVFFTYTNPPDYGWNFETPNQHTSALVQGNDGNFYGTTYEGGKNYILVTEPPTYGYGTVFKMTPAGAFTSLYSFGSVNNPSGAPGGDGRGPVGNLTKGADGNLYGTTIYGGYVPDADNGTIFQITTNGALTTLYSFGSLGIYITNNLYTWPDGRFPSAGVVQDSAGNFYGTTTTSGSGQQGTIYQLTSGGTLNVLYEFPYYTNTAFNVDGGMPGSELTKGPDGNFYGTTYEGGTNGSGIIFRITTNGTFAALYSFSANAAGTYAPLLLGKDGKFYGTAQAIGNDNGIIFRFTTNGVFTVLYTFVSMGTPSGLIQGSDGNFYGTTPQGGPSEYYYPNGCGTIFQMTTNGTLTTLYSFSGPDGVEPQGALVQGTDGSFYGTTSYGGPNSDSGLPANPPPANPGYGTIFRIIIQPVFQSITPTNGNMALAWTIMPGQTYQLQYSTNLTSATWFNLGSSVTASNTTASATDPIGSDLQRFYRILLTQ